MSNSIRDLVWYCTAVAQLCMNLTDVQAIWGLSVEVRKEGNVLFNDKLNTLYLYGFEHMIKYHSDSKRKPAIATTWVTLSD